MNTKKFIKRVNQLGDYRCKADRKYTFFIQYHEGANAIRIDTLLEQIDATNCCVFERDTGAGKKILKLLRKYLKSDEPWVEPKQKWFKRGLNDDMA